MFLLDTNICIFYLNGRFNLAQKIKDIGKENCFISEITVAELKFGAANSAYPERNYQIITAFQAEIQIIPIFGALDFYAKEKVRLRKLGIPIDEFDLLIGATAIANGLTMVTNNTNHFARIENIQLEDWTVQNT